MMIFVLEGAQDRALGSVVPRSVSASAASRLRVGSGAPRETILCDSLVNSTV